MQVVFPCISKASNHCVLPRTSCIQTHSLHILPYMCLRHGSPHPSQVIAVWGYNRAPAGVGPCCGWMWAANITSQPKHPVAHCHGNPDISTVQAKTLQLKIIFILLAERMTNHEKTRNIRLMYFLPLKTEMF